MKYTQDYHTAFGNFVDRHVVIAGDHQLTSTRMASRSPALRKSTQKVRLAFNSVVHADSGRHIIAGDKLESLNPVIQSKRMLLKFHASPAASRSEGANVSHARLHFVVGNTRPGIAKRFPHLGSELGIVCGSIDRQASRQSAFIGDAGLNRNGRHESPAYAW